MTTDFSLMDVMGNFTGGGSVAPDDTTDVVSTATTQVSTTPEPKKSFINPKYALKTSAVAPAEPSTAAPAVPSQAAYNASIAQQESGGRTDIGFHNKEKSSAFGPYGTTAAGWADARKVNPALPEDITKATPEQLTAGQDAYTQQNAKYLQSYGVEVNPNTLAAAHFLGAKGLSDYMKTGAISPQAAAANGGEENVRRIVNARLGGQAAPASGAVQAQPAQQPASETKPISPEQAAQQPTAEGYTGQGLKVGGQTAESLKQEQGYHSILNSNSQQEIGKLAFSLDTPKDVQRAALDKLQNTMAVEDGMRKAQAVAQNLGQNPTPQALNKAMNDKDTGSYFKVLMYQALGWVSKAKEELDKIDPKTVYSQTSIDGVNYSTKVNPNTNEILGAWDAAGNPADKATLTRLQAEGFNAKAMGHVKEVVKVGDKTIGVYQDGSMVDLGTKQRYTGSLAGAEKLTGDVGKAGATRVRDADGTEWSVVPTEKGSVFYDNSGNKGVPKGKTVPIQGGTDVELQAQLLRERSKAKINDLIASLNAKNIAEPTTAANKFIAEFNAQNGTDIKPSDIDWSRLKVPAGAPAPQTGAVAPAAAPGATAAAAPVSPEQAAQPVPAAAAAAPAAQKVVPTTAVTLPAQPKFREPGFETESPNAFKIRMDDFKKRFEKVSEKEQAKMTNAQDIYNVAKDINDTLPKATGSVIGAKVDQLAGVFGYSTEGAQAIAQLQVLGNKILMNVPRFEGPQSDRDTEVYKQAAGQLSNPEVPVKTRVAAFKTIMEINKKYAPDLDWNFSQKPTDSAIKPGTRKTIPGKGTFEFDGKGWKAV